MRKAALLWSVLLAVGPTMAQPATPPPASAAPEPALGPKEPARGVYAMTRKGAVLHLTVTGHHFTSRDALEKYLAYRAAAGTLANRNQWFSLVEHRTRADKVSVAKDDPSGPRYSFRMAYFRPQWRYRLNGAKAWSVWSPLSGTSFPVLTGATAYQLSADILMHKGMVDDVSPFAFDASALSDYLINQVTAPD